jgi:hypothetical protein
MIRKGVAMIGKGIERDRQTESDNCWKREDHKIIKRKNGK